MGFIWGIITLFGVFWLVSVISKLNKNADEAMQERRERREQGELAAVTTPIGSREDEWSGIQESMQELIEFDTSTEADGDWGTIDLSRMEIDDSSVGEGYESGSEYLLRKGATGWEFKQLWMSYKPFGGPEDRKTPAEKVQEDFGLGTPDWDPDLEAQYHRRLARAQSWQPVPESLSRLIGEKYDRAMAFFRQHPGLHPSMSEAEFVSGKYDANRIWTPPIHPENAASERFVLVCTEGPAKGQGFPLRVCGLLLVGRSPDCDWSIRRDDTILDRQFQLKVTEDSVVLRDLGGGTAINGEKPGERTLVPGDVIKIGHTSIKFVEPQRKAPETSSRRPKEKSSFDVWCETYPEAAVALGEANRRLQADSKPMYEAYSEAIRPFADQKKKALAAIKIAYDEMVRPAKEELEREAKPLRESYRKQDTDLYEEAARPLFEKYHRATISANKMLGAAERAAEETYNAQIRPLHDALKRDLEPLEKVRTEEHARIRASTKPAPGS